jgi:hypothetical protein
MSEFVKGQCPLCGSGVFVGSCGWLTCSGSECPDPLFVGEIFEKYKESNSNLGELMRIVKQLEAMTVPAPRLEHEALLSIAQYDPRWTGQHVNNAPSRAQLIAKAFDALCAPPVGTQEKEN